MVYIYALIDPRNGMCRYIGKTTNIHARMSQHLREKAKTKRRNWVLGLRAAGLGPELVVIEECPAEVWVEAEQFWIAYMRFIGASLLNMTIGGDGCLFGGKPAHGWSEESRAKISKSAKAYWSRPENAARLSAMQKEKFANPEYRAKRTAEFLARMQTEEFRLAQREAMRISAVTRRKPEISPAMREESVARMKGLWATDEYRAKITNALNTPEAKEANRQRAFAMNKDPEYIAKRKTRWEDPEFRERHAAGIRANWEKRKLKETNND